MWNADCEAPAYWLSAIRDARRPTRAIRAREYLAQCDAHRAVSKVPLRNHGHWKSAPGLAQLFNCLDRHNAIVGSRDQRNFFGVEQRFAVKRRRKMRMLQ